MGLTLSARSSDGMSLSLSDRRMVGSTMFPSSSAGQAGRQLYGGLSAISVTEICLHGDP